MASRTSARSLLAAALLALQLWEGAIAGPLEGNRATHIAAGNPQTYTPAASWDRLATTPGAGVGDEISLRTTRAADGTIQVEVTLALPVSHEVVWAVLTDYENMPRFVQDIRATRVISTGPGRQRVEIDGVARFLVMDFPISTTVDVVYQPAGSIAIDSVAGNLAIHGVMRVEGEGAFTRVDYRVRVAPDFWLPPLIGNFLIGRLVKRQFEGMAAEMHRRADGRQTWAPDGPERGRFRPASRRQE